MKLRTALLRNIPELMRPIIRLFVQHSITLQEILPQIKRVYVEESQRALAKRGEKASKSKISVLSGVHRPEVTTLLSEAPADTKPKPTSLLMKIIHRWQHQPEFTTKGGNPSVLSCEGTESEFYNLVQSTSRAVNPYTILNELLESKLAERTTKGVRLSANVYQNNKDIEETFLFLGKDMTDYVASVEQNLSTDSEDLNHHITTEFDNIPSAEIKNIKTWLSREGALFHKKVRGYLANLDRDYASSKSNQKKLCTKGTLRAVFGSFSFIENLDHNKLAKEK